MKYTHKRHRHGMTNTVVYSRWIGMLARCYRKSAKSYEHYGGRGIKVEWKSFLDFYRDMGNPPEGTTLDRINNDGNYSKENCRWVIKSIQNSNRRNNIYLTFKGEIKTMTQWAKELGLNKRTLWGRLNIYKMPVDKALSLKVIH